MANVASVAVELYEFCSLSFSFLLPPPFFLNSPAGVWEWRPQREVSCFNVWSTSTAVHNLFQCVLSELMAQTPMAKKCIHQSWLCASPCRRFCRNPCLITKITLEPTPGNSLFFPGHALSGIRRRPVCLYIAVMAECSNYPNISKFDATVWFVEHENALVPMWYRWSFVWFSGKGCSVY